MSGIAGICNLDGRPVDPAPPTAIADSPAGLRGGPRSAQQGGSSGSVVERPHRRRGVRRSSAKYTLLPLDSESPDFEALRPIGINRESSFQT